MPAAGISKRSSYFTFSRSHAHLYQIPDAGANSLAHTGTQRAPQTAATAPTTTENIGLMKNLQFKIY